MELERNMAFIKNQDPEVGTAIEAEYKRQQEGIELIASENFASPAVMAAMGTVLTNKYAEGYPGKRYYGGCQCVDVVEELARKRACALFGADHANVQPHSGAQANMAVYFAFLKPGDTVLGMSLAPVSYTHLDVYKRQILERAGKYYTQIKIDEITNLGAVKIRLRSLLGALEEKEEH